jgi:hypothetical protein
MIPEKIEEWEPFPLKCSPILKIFYELFLIPISNIKIKIVDKMHLYI